MNIQIFNSIVEIGSNWKNLLFFLVIAYSIIMTGLYFKTKVELTNVTDYYQIQLLILEDYYRVDKKQTRIRFYERYVEEKERILNNYKNELDREEGEE